MQKSPAYAGDFNRGQGRRRSVDLWFFSSAGEVPAFLAGDAAYLVKDEVIENLQGIGTGALRETLPALAAAGASMFVSGMSSKSRGVSEEDLVGKGIEFAGPSQLVDLTFEADRVLCY